MSHFKYTGKVSIALAFDNLSSPIFQKTQAHTLKTCQTMLYYLYCCTFDGVSALKEKKRKKPISSIQLPTSRCLANSYAYFKTQHRNHFPWYLFLTHPRLCSIISHTYLCHSTHHSLSPTTSPQWIMNAFKVGAVISSPTSPSTQDHSWPNVSWITNWTFRMSSYRQMPSLIGDLNHLSTQID